jgi:hypothetical protein
MVLTPPDRTLFPTATAASATAGGVVLTNELPAIAEAPYPR